MKSLTIRRCPDKLLAAMKAAAARNGHSLNQEALARLRRGVDIYHLPALKGAELKRAHEHIRKRSGTWDGTVSGEELLKMTRP